MTMLSQVAASLCRLWTAIYTAGLPDAVRAARRAEIESDLWESAAEDRRAAAVAGSMMTRLLFGLPHDLLWRMELADRQSMVSRRSLLAITVAVALFVTVTWTWTILRIELPEPAPAMHFVASPAPPPPPPPPPPEWSLEQNARAGRGSRP